MYIQELLLLTMLLSRFPAEKPILVDPMVILCQSICNLACDLVNIFLQTVHMFLVIATGDLCYCIFWSQILNCPVLYG